MMQLKPWVVTGMLIVLLGGCAASREDKPKIPLESDPRIGESVDQVCFTRNIRSWDSVDNDRNGVLLKMINRDEYKLKLTPGCNPDWAMVHVAVITRTGSGCYSRGDMIKTDGDVAQGRGSACTIVRINKWHPEKVEPSKEGQGS
jgi:hypothetical protein